MSKESTPLPEAENPYRQYEGAPTILDAQTAIDSGVVVTHGDNAILHLDGQEISIGPKHQNRHITQLALAALEGKLKPYTPEYETWSQELDSLDTHGQLRHGRIVYYPYCDRLDWFPTSDFHRLVQMHSNAGLFCELGLTFAQQRQIFDQLIIGIGGGSVGGVAALEIQKLVIGGLKIADGIIFSPRASNRTRAGVRQWGINKAEAVAGMAHEVDPGLPISVYPYLTPDNLTPFISGDPQINEPRLSFAVDEMDSLPAKIAFLEHARQARIPLLRISDVDRACIVDYWPFDKYPDYPLAFQETIRDDYSIALEPLPDEALFQAFEKWGSASPHEKGTLFLRVAEMLVGGYFRRKPQFLATMDPSSELPFIGFIPQIGAVTSAGSGQLSVAIAAIAQHQKWPGRTIYDLRDQRVFTSEPL